MCIVHNFSAWDLCNITYCNLDSFCYTRLSNKGTATQEQHRKEGKAMTYKLTFSTAIGNAQFTISATSHDLAIEYGFNMVEDELFMNREDATLIDIFSFNA